MRYPYLIPSRLFWLSPAIACFLIHPGDPSSALLFICTITSGRLVSILQMDTYFPSLLSFRSASSPILLVLRLQVAGLRSLSYRL
ncbi:hypothetical protein GGR53DRAFT_367892 [Hypoxylon sp. FL1150]|nr:hypothetical protein GGR53DRAFT_367892 [Hypoxylon sp. FL1150]